MYYDEVTRIQEVYKERDALANKECNLLFSPSSHLNRYFLDQLLCTSLKKMFPDGISDVVALDVGCGSGALLQFLNNLGADLRNLYGIELSEQRILVAKSRSPNMNFELGVGDLPYDSNKFDLITAMTVFTSILSAELRQKLADDMSACLKRTACIIIYDFKYNNLKNHQAKALTNNEVKKLFPQHEINKFSVTLAPPISRKICKVSMTLSYLLEKFFPFLCTHNLYVITPRNMKESL